jgi:23S rRNA pseudouridine955/2504/2580 synthase
LRNVKREPFEKYVLWESGDLLALNKPPLVATLDERQGNAPSMLRWAKALDERLSPCHRLDKETSGIMLWARSEAAYKATALAFEQRLVSKVYHAVVWGIHQFEDQAIDLPIGQGRDGLMRVDFREGKSAITHIRSLEFFRHFTLVECRPVTGRTHQIRVHLASQNCRIVADQAYGGEMPLLSLLKGRKYRMSRDKEQEAPMIQRLALHARSLEIDRGDWPMPRVEAPYPRDFEVLLRLLRKYDT